jgi:hypothetical protein
MELPGSQVTSTARLSIDLVFSGDTTGASSLRLYIKAHHGSLPLSLSFFPAIFALVTYNGEGSDEPGLTEGSGRVAMLRSQRHQLSRAGSTNGNEDGGHARCPALLLHLRLTYIPVLLFFWLAVVSGAHHGDRCGLSRDCGGDAIVG